MGSRAGPGRACRRELGERVEAEIPAVGLGSETSDQTHSAVIECVPCALLDEMERNSPNPVLALCTRV